MLVAAVWMDRRPHNFAQALVSLRRRVVTLNNVKTKQGWMYAAGVLVAFLVLKVYMIASKVLQKRRHLRALEDVKKM